MSTDLRVTHIERRPRHKRLAVHLSDGRELSLTPDVAVRFRITAGLGLAPERVDAVAAAQSREDALATALRLIAYRPRSEKEMRLALARRRVPSEVQEGAVSRLRELGLIDDRAFAASFVESRNEGSPRGRRLLAQELRQKGVAREIASESTAAVDDSDAAYRAAERRSAALAALPYADFERRLGAYLLRRGFGYETTRETIRRLWRERAIADGEIGAGPSNLA